MDKKYQIFVSSTFTDLEEERQVVLKQIAILGHIPSGMEYFSASPLEQFKYISKRIDQCDYYIVIIGGRYGSTDSDGISYTEKEFNYAIEKNIPILAFIHKDIDKIEYGKTDKDQILMNNLQNFISKAKTGRMVVEWDTAGTLGAAIVTTLAEAFSELPAIGWVKGDAVASEDILEQINDLRLTNEKIAIENKTLRNQLKPIINNIATIEASHTIFYQFDKYNGYFDETHYDSMQTTWRQIFFLTADEFRAPKPPAMMESILNNWLSRSTGKKYVKITRESLTIIKAQLEAYNFITIYNAEKIGGGVTEFAHLTELRKKTLLEISVHVQG